MYLSERTLPEDLFVRTVLPRKLQTWQSRLKRSKDRTEWRHSHLVREGGREGERKGGREGRREGQKEGGRGEEGREREREGGREGGREGERGGGREGREEREYACDKTKEPEAITIPHETVSRSRHRAKVT